MDEELIETWEKVAPGLSLAQLDNLERNGVSIQCLNSSDFVIGRQTNFNGPVTVITCAEVLRQRNYEDKREHNEDVVIREKVLSKSAAMKVQKLATDKVQTDEQKDTPPPSRFGRFKKTFWVFTTVCFGLLVAGSVTLAVFLTATDNPLPKCTLLPNTNCIFSGFDWGGRGNTTQLKPLQIPVSYVIISQTYDEFCYEISVCLSFIKLLQLNPAEEAVCNFFVGGDGNVYEDRGWVWESDLEGPAVGNALQICIMGNHSDEEYPTYPQMATTLVLVQFGVENDYIAEDYVLVPVNATSPRKYLGSIYGVIKKWPNFSENPFGFPVVTQWMDLDKKDEK